MGNWKLVLTIIGLFGAGSAWQHHAIDYRQHPPTVLIAGAARDTLNAAYDSYASADSSAPLLEQGFCASSWTTVHPTWNTTVVHITTVRRSEVNASPISVSIPCAQATSIGGGIVFHTHPPQQCVIRENWTAWSGCVRSADQEAECKASWLDMADTVRNQGIPARFLVCGEDRFVLYHATGEL